MSTYHQLTSGERHELSALRKLGLKPAAIAKAMGRHRSTIYRELTRNTRKDGGYRPATAAQMTRGRRSRSRRNQRFGDDDWALVMTHLEKEWSPEQVAGRLREDGVLRISHETIYRHIWRDKRHGGTRFKLLRQTAKKRRKRYRSNDSRGRLAAKRNISERPSAVEPRHEVGHWEIDTASDAESPASSHSSSGLPDTS